MTVPAAITGYRELINMHDCDESEDKNPLPAQQTQQPQPPVGTQDGGWAARAASLAQGVFGAENSEAAVSRGKEELPGLDEARFTAGIVRFYEAVLKEPVPEKMLRLVDEIAKQERKL